jgi:hypothetical protein
VTYPQNQPGQPWPPASGQVYGQPPTSPAYGQPPTSPAYGQPPTSPAYGQPPTSPAYGQPPPGYPPVGYPPQPPRKKSNAGLIVLIVVIAVIVLCGGSVLTIALVGSKGSTGTASSSAHHTFNEPVRDGKFEFVVKSLTCGKAKEGDEVLNKTAQGQYCEVALSVKNIGTEAQIFDGSSQKAKGANGATYENDGEAEIYANSDNDTFLNKINPGNQATGTVIFDIPKDGKIVSLELHDSPFSGGVTVDAP